MKIHSNKKTQANKKFPTALRTNESSLNESYNAIPRDPNSLTGHIKYHIIQIENGLTFIYIVIS